MKIIRDKVICMLFYIECTKENIAKCKKGMEELKEFEICYDINPKQPVLMTLRRIYEYPHTYRLHE
jgi:hypothetical protein